MNPGRSASRPVRTARRSGESPPSGTTLPQLTGYLLRRAYAKAAMNAQACIGEETHVREVAMLAILDERGALSQRALADLTHINRTIMVKLVDSVELRGWVVRERNPDDRRSYALRLTAVGTKALAKFRRDLDHSEALLVRELTVEQRQRLKTELLRLLEGEVWLSIDALSGYAGFLIAQAHRLVRGWALDALEPLHLDPRDFGVLAAIGRDQPCTQNHLAHMLGVSPSAALGFVEELETAGLVQRERNAEDRRSYDLRLTDAGTKRWSQARAAAAAVQARVVDRLGEPADTELRQLLTRVIQD